MQPIFQANQQSFRLSEGHPRDHSPITVSLLDP
jgi:hypothetical protein